MGKAKLLKASEVECVRKAVWSEFTRTYFVAHPRPSHLPPSTSSPPRSSVSIDVFHPYFPLEGVICAEWCLFTGPGLPIALNG